MENPDMYKGIDNVTLQNAAVKGNNLHKIIENYELYGTIMPNSPELLNYIEIKRKYNIIKKHT